MISQAPCQYHLLDTGQDKRGVIKVSGQVFWVNTCLFQIGGCFYSLKADPEIIPGVFGICLIEYLCAREDDKEIPAGEIVCPVSCHKTSFSATDKVNDIKLSLSGTKEMAGQAVLNSAGGQENIYCIILQMIQTLESYDIDEIFFRFGFPGECCLWWDFSGRFLFLGWEFLIVMRHDRSSSEIRS
jgi:hypothetical protein